MSFSFVMSIGVVVRSIGITDPSASGAAAWPATRRTDSRPRRVSITTWALESRGRETPLLTARSMATRPPSIRTAFTLPAFRPATVTWSPGWMPAASLKYAVT